MAKPAPIHERANSEELASLRPLRRTLPLRRRKIIKKSLWGVLGVLAGWGILSYFLYLWLGQDPAELPERVAANRPALIFYWFLILGVLLLWKTAYQILYFVTYFYDMDDKNVIIRKGVLAKREITLPFSKITDVYVDQDLLDVFFALYDVHISTPTEQSGKFAHIDGVNKRSAMKLRGLILERIHLEDDTK